MIRGNGGWDAFNMLEIEKFPCNDGNECRKRENEVMREMKANLNMRSAHCGYDTVKEYNKQYRDNNKEKIKDYKKNYRIDNKETINEYNKQYRIDNKETIKDYKNQYYNDNKDKISEKALEKVTCECGCMCTRASIARHRKTKKHIQRMEQLQ
jgi:hypothetical protein